MFKGERTGIFWIGLIIVALASTVLFSTFWSSMVIYPLLSDPEFILHTAIDTGMSPRSIMDGLDWSFFQAYPWLSYDGRNYFQSDHYWEFMVPPIVGASTFILIGLYMMKSGAKKEKERKIQLLKQQ